MVGAAASGCGGGAARKTTGPTTTLMTADRWTPPAVPAGAGTEGFCTVVVAVYRHMGDIPHAATEKVKSQIVSDYVSEAPVMISSAPPPVGADARLYFTSVAKILGDLQKASLDPHKLSDPNLGQLLLDPAVKSAGDRVIAFVKDNCGYTIGG